MWVETSWPDGSVWVLLDKDGVEGVTELTVLRPEHQSFQFPLEYKSQNISYHVESLLGLFKISEVKWEKR